MLFGASLTFHERAILANEQVEMRPLFVSKFEKDLLPLGILETLAVLLEEAMGAAFAADPDHQRLLVVDAVHQSLRPVGEQSVRRTLEEEKRRPGLQLRVPPQQLGVTLFERREVFLLLGCEVLENFAAPRITGDPGGAGVEVQTAALGGNRDTQRVAREHEVGVAVIGSCRQVAAAAAVLTLPVHLHHALGSGEPTRGGNLLDQSLDVRAEELERFVA